MPRLLDLYCGVGGASSGYQRAGFDVDGVDWHDQPNYIGDNFYCSNVLELAPKFLSQYDAIHASPPCQCFTVYGNNAAHIKTTHENLIPETRELLRATGKPYVIENVPRAPLESPIQLCGTSFGIEVRRHRLFEASFPLDPPPCDHERFTERKYPGSTNRPNGRTVCNVGEYRVPLALQQEAMEMPWANLAELSQAIPPVYTEWIGSQLLAYV